MRTASFVDPELWARLRARADVPPLRRRVPLRAGAAVVGSVEPDLFNRIDLKPPSDGRFLLFKEEQNGTVTGWVLTGDVSAGLNALALALHQAGLAGAWRDEQLAVAGPAGDVLGTVERAAVRPLGLTTHAVHLVGWAADGRIWVQQRALTKSNDPGLWDTLMGGMVPASDTLQQALARETWEEAGLQLAQLRDLRHGGRCSFRGPAQDGAGTGYVVEHIDWFTCTVPDGVRPVNQDGEVAQFALLEPGEVLRRMQRDEFTLEAAVILASAPLW